MPGTVCLDAGSALRLSGMRGLDGARPVPRNSSPRRWSAGSDRDGRQAGRRSSRLCDGSQRGCPAPTGDHTRARTVGAGAGGTGEHIVKSTVRVFGFEEVII